MSKKAEGSALRFVFVKPGNISRKSLSKVLRKFVKNFERLQEGIEAKLEELQKELLKRANSKKDYNGMAEEIYCLRDLKQNALVASAEREGLKKRIAEMREFLDSQPTEVLEYDEQLVRRLIEKVTVYDKQFEVEFKSGTAVDVYH